MKFTIQPDKYGERFQDEIARRLAQKRAAKTSLRPAENPDLLRTLWEKNQKTISHFPQTVEHLETHQVECAKESCWLSSLIGKLSGLFHGLKRN